MPKIEKIEKDRHTRVSLCVNGAVDQSYSTMGTRGLPSARRVTQGVCTLIWSTPRSRVGLCLGYATTNNHKQKISAIINSRNKK